MKFKSGALAGTTCDFISYPLDTLKTRLQSQHGFLRSGGFNQLYKGLGPVMIGSAPSASLFFITYEGLKEVFQPRIPDQYHSIIHMTAASLGEMAACFIRVPVEVVKQRRQALLSDSHKLPLRTLYRGYGSTVIRDLPFGLIQMPLWEYFKLYWKRHVKRECTPLESAICGSISVAISAILTTPLDVAKTRIMLSNMTVAKDEVKISIMLNKIYRENGLKGLFAGFLPRVGGFTISGFIFFGVYDKVKEICISILPP
ncbi:PREDICTED: S-adenosylmethionine mitochondrial carrier protein-like isoform X2 [Eufriesea mexicana]|uniref:S-adenosylmethionine mitochondrial carrier protein-like isoform X2 n=1 Tax=Eufriesea mexicana TaxID=516756 RepID=UPI00083C572D|nr:PREDICTED: S-adenosylmethionine mitochondrial carrier protein-like isoform X2 [Eufriesea mexicana]